MTIFEKIKEINVSDIHSMAESIMDLNSNVWFCSLCECICENGPCVYTDEDCVARIEQWLQKEVVEFN